jgi:hypothetical protein
MNGATATTALERFSPQLMYHLLTAARRVEPDYYNHLCRRFNLDADRILGLFGQLDEIGSGQLSEVLDALHEHECYDDIVFLAGRNAFHMAAQDAGQKSSGGGVARFCQLVKNLLPPFLGKATLHSMSKGSIQFVEIQNSLFARSALSIRPLCGFYSGWLGECAHLCTDGRCAVAEVRCKAMDANASSCMFQVAL